MLREARFCANTAASLHITRPMQYMHTCKHNECQVDEWHKASHLFKLAESAQCPLHVTELLSLFLHAALLLSWLAQVTINTLHAIATALRVHESAWSARAQVVTFRAYSWQGGAAKFWRGDRIDETQHRCVRWRRCDWRVLHPHPQHWCRGRRCEQLYSVRLKDRCLSWWW